MKRRDLLKRLHAGAVIRMEYIGQPQASAKMTYRMSPGGESIRPETIQQLLSDHLIKPGDDGLPGIGASQTYVLWRASEGGA